MRDRFIRCALTVVLLTTTARSGEERKGLSKADAARRPQGGPFLLSHRALRVELHLNAAQEEKVKDVLESVGKSYPTELSAARQLPEVQRLARLRGYLARVSGEIKTALEFTTEQSRRLDQIILQHRRFEAFLDREVTAKLKLHSAQRAEIEELNARRKESLRAVDLHAGDGPAAAKQRAALNHKLADEVVAGFDPEQRKIWKELTGKPFELPEPEVRRPD